MLLFCASLPAVHLYTLLLCFLLACVAVAVLLYFFCVLFWVCRQNQLTATYSFSVLLSFTLYHICPNMALFYRCLVISHKPTSRVNKKNADVVLFNTRAPQHHHVVRVVVTSLYHKF